MFKRQILSFEGFGGGFLVIPFNKFKNVRRQNVAATIHQP